MTTESLANVGSSQLASLDVSDDDTHTDVRDTVVNIVDDLKDTADGEFQEDEIVDLPDSMEEEIEDPPDLMVWPLVNVEQDPVEDAVEGPFDAVIQAETPFYNFYPFQIIVSEN